MEELFKIALIVDNHSSNFKKIKEQLMLHLETYDKVKKSKYSYTTSKISIDFICKNNRIVDYESYNEIICCNFNGLKRTEVGPTQNKVMMNTVSSYKRNFQVANDFVREVNGEYYYVFYMGIIDFVCDRICSLYDNKTIFYYIKNNKICSFITYDKIKKMPSNIGYYSNDRNEIEVRLIANIQKEIINHNNKVYELQSIISAV